MAAQEERGEFELDPLSPLHAPSIRQLITGMPPVDIVPTVEAVRVDIEEEELPTDETVWTIGTIEEVYRRGEA